MKEKEARAKFRQVGHILSPFFCFLKHVVSKVYKTVKIFISHEIKCRIVSGCCVSFLLTKILFMSMFQIVSAVHYCHQKNIVHRDLKVIVLCHDLVIHISIK